MLVQQGVGSGGGRWHVILCASLLAVSAAAFQRTSGTAPHWMLAQPMHLARSDATITLLRDGTVLIAGGLGPHGPLASAEVYDPRTHIWTRTGPLHVARYYHTATLLHTGQVLVTGGQDASHVLASAEVYTPRTHTWAMVAPMHDARTLHTATLLRDGTVLVVGGSSQTTWGQASAEIYNPRTGQWHLTGHLIAGRSAHRAVLLPTGRVLVMGGDGTDSADTLASIEVYDPRTGRWARARSLLFPRDTFTATMLPSGRVLVAGVPGPIFLARCHLIGQRCPYPPDAEVYDPLTQRSTPTGRMSTLRQGHTATLLADGTVLVAGGNGGTCGNANCPYVASAEIYQLRMNAWIPTKSMHHARIFAAAVRLHDGTVLVAGGSAATTLSSTEIYEP